MIPPSNLPPTEQTRGGSWRVQLLLETPPKFHRSFRELVCYDNAIHGFCRVNRQKPVNWQSLESPSVKLCKIHESVESYWHRTLVLDVFFEICLRTVTKVGKKQRFVIFSEISAKNILRMLKLHTTSQYVLFFAFWNGAKVRKSCGTWKMLYNECLK